MDYVEFDHEPLANLTTMVVAFGGWIDAGQAATGALQHLVQRLSAPRLASIDPEEFFVFTQERPEVRMTADGGRAIQWPQSEFFSWQPRDGRAGLLLFCGMEPHQKWRTYTKALLDVAEHCGVTRIVSLGALLLKGCTNFGSITIIDNKTIGCMTKGAERPGVISPCSKTYYFTRYYSPHELTLRPSLPMIVYQKKSSYFRKL